MAAKGLRALGVARSFPVPFSPADDETKAIEEKTAESEGKGEESEERKESKETKETKEEKESKEEKGALVCLFIWRSYSLLWFALQSSGG